MREIVLPIKQEELQSLKVGEMVYLTGHLYTARDAAHKLMTEAYNKAFTKLKVVLVRNT